MGLPRKKVHRDTLRESLSERMKKFSFKKNLGEIDFLSTNSQILHKKKIDTNFGVLEFSKILCTRNTRLRSRLLILEK